MAATQHPPTRRKPQITQIDADVFLVVNLRYLRHLRADSKKLSKHHDWSARGTDSHLIFHCFV